MKTKEDYFKIGIEEEVLKNLLDNGKITLDEKYYHERSIKLMKEAQEFGFQKGKLEERERIENILIEKRDYYKKLWIKAVDEGNKHQEDIFYNTYFNFDELIKQLSKEIGGIEE